MPSNASDSMASLRREEIREAVRSVFGTLGALVFLLFAGGSLLMLGILVLLTVFARPLRPDETMPVVVFLGLMWFSCIPGVFFALIAGKELWHTLAPSAARFACPPKEKRSALHSAGVSWISPGQVGKKGRLWLFDEHLEFTSSVFSLLRPSLVLRLEDVRIISRVAGDALAMLEITDAMGQKRLFTTLPPFAWSKRIAMACQAVGLEPKMELASDETHLFESRMIPKEGGYREPSRLGAKPAYVPFEESLNGQPSVAVEAIRKA